jgi:hypothetical protein
MAILWLEVAYHRGYTPQNQGGTNPIHRASDSQASNYKLSDFQKYVCSTMKCLCTAISDRLNSSYYCDFL